MKVRPFTLLLIITAALAACKKQIRPAVISSPTNYLVVQGNISMGDSTIIYLSRTVKIYDSVASTPELNAKVSVESSIGSSYPLTAKGNGTYICAPINLSPAATYRVKIITGSGSQYASDFVAVKNSPPIDSVNAAIGSNGLNININTHDDAANTHYYRWDYTETYIIRMEYYSNYMQVNHDTIFLRPADQQIYQCWVSDTSSNIVLGSSTKLAKDIISDQSILLLPSTSEKLHIRYSILVKQYALTADAYNYFTLLKKNTEQLGSIFDAQPSSLTGNIHSITNPQEPVIGYVTAGGVQEQRIFVDNKDLPSSWIAILPFGGCSADTLLYARFIPSRSDPSSGLVQREVHDLLYSGVKIPIDKVGDYPSGGFTGAFPYCVDCTLRGVNKAPSFWK